MNQRIQDIADKVSTNIEAKAVSTPNPARVSAEDHAEIENDILGVLDDLLTNATPIPPAGVKWQVTPVVEIVGNSLDVSDGTINDNGGLVDVDADSITVTLPATGFQKPVALVANYSAVPAVYEVIESPATGINDSYTFPPIPAGRLWVAYFMVTDGGIAISPTGDPTKLPIQVAYGTGVTLKFDTDRDYNTDTSPGTGNIIIDTTGLTNGVVVTCVHNSGTEPQVNSLPIGTPASPSTLVHWVDGASEYELGVNNYFEMRVRFGKIHTSIYRLMS